jgi:hypothetical protein
MEAMKTMALIKKELDKEQQKTLYQLLKTSPQRQKWLGFKSKLLDQTYRQIFEEMNNDIDLPLDNPKHSATFHTIIANADNALIDKKYIETTIGTTIPE